MTFPDTSELDFGVVSAGQVRDTISCQSETPKADFPLRDGIVTFYKNIIESCWTSILKILTKSILQEKSHFRAAGHFPKLSRFRTEIMSRNVPQQHFVP